MFSKVSVLVPTRNRTERLRMLIESFDRTTGQDAELIFKVDDDDQASRNFLLSWGGHQIVSSPRDAGYSDMPKFYNEMASCATGDVLMVGNDDMIFHTLRWPAIILAAANRYPDGVFDFGVSTYNEDHYPFSIVSKNVIAALGFFWDPRIFWGDIFLRDVMGTLGRLEILPMAIEHDWVGHTPDSTFSEANQNDIYRRDPNYWSGTHAVAVREAVVRLKRLIENPVSAGA